MDFEIRAIDESEVQLFRTRLTRGFGGDLSDKDEAGSERFSAIVPLVRTRAAFAGTEMIGTLACFPFKLSVPGGSVAMGGTTMITVQPTHSRRGALRAMMLSHLEDVRAAAEPIAGLWASETPIYGRFGFGIASHRHEIELDAGLVHFTEEDTCHQGMSRARQVGEHPTTGERYIHCAGRPAETDPVFPPLPHPRLGGCCAPLRRRSQNVMDPRARVRICY